MKSLGKSIFATLLVMVMVLSLLTACGKKPEPDPSQDNDVSTGVSQDENSDVVDDTTDSTDEGADATDETGDSTDESADATDESADATDESADATDESSDTTTGDGKVTTTEKDETTTTTKKGETTKKTTAGKTTTTKKGETTKKTTTGKTTTKKTTSGKTTTTTKGGGGIIVDKTTTSKTQATTTTEHEVNQNTKDKILAMFDSSMKGKMATILIHFKAENDTPRLQQMLDETGVKIKFMICDLKDYGTRLSALINATAAPDVAYMTTGHYPSLVIKGFMQDLTATKHNTKADIFDQQLMESYIWNGKNYGLITKNSTEGHFMVTFYNKTIFNRNGVTDPGVLWKQGKWNWDTFLECAKQVNDSANGVWGCELYASHNFLCTGGLPIVSVGDGVITNNLDKQPIIDAWNFVNKLHHVDKVTTGLAGADTNFATGKSVMMVGENWMWGTVEPIGGTTKDDWGVVPAPCAPGITPVAITSPRAACIPVGAKNPDLGLAAYVYWVSYDTYKDLDDVDEQPANYPYNEIMELTDVLWDMPKIMDVSTGIVEYGGEYSEWDFSFDVFQAGMSGISANIDKWKSAIDVNIKRILTEFS